MASVYQVSVGPVVMGTGFGRTDSCSNPRNTLGRGMEPNHPELGLDSDVARRVNRVQTPKKNKKNMASVLSFLLANFSKLFKNLIMPLLYL